jgi:4-amino-4-deoxy-L-arabinose transferase-like glycosyltransferase
MTTVCERLGLTWGVGLWSGAVALALGAQTMLVHPQLVPLALVLYGLAAGLVTWGAALIDRTAPLPDPMRTPTGREPRPVRSRRYRYAGLALVAAGIVLDLAAVASVALSGTSMTAFPLWLGAMLLVTAGVCVGAGWPWHLPRSWSATLEVLGVLAILAVALAFRLPSLGSIPADVHGDEASVGLAARQLLNGPPTNIFSPGWGLLPQLSFAASALTMRLFGDDLTGLRLASVIQGSLAVGLLYGVARRLFSVRVAVLAALVLASSQMAVHFSRSGLNNIQALVVSLLVLYFLLRGLQTGHPAEFLAAGLSAGLAISVYDAARLILLLAALYCLYRALVEPGFLEQHGRNLLLAAFGAGLFVAPQLVWFAHDPGSALGRLAAVSVLRPDNMAHEYSAYHVNSVAQVLWHQVVNSMAAFNVRGETSQSYNQVGPLLDRWSGPLFVLGLGLVTLRPGSPRHFLLASWFWLTIGLGSVLTLDALFATHIIGLLGVLAILPCLVIDLGQRALTGRFGVRGAWGAGLMAAFFCGLVITSNAIGYFDRHVRTMEPEGFFTVLARYVQPINGHSRVYLFGDANTPLLHETVRFLVPQIDGVNVRNRALPVPLDRVPAAKGVVFVDSAVDDPRFAAVRAAYPGGVLEEHRNNHGIIAFYSYRVDHASLVAAAPSAAIDHTPIPGLESDALPPPT